MTADEIMSASTTHLRARPSAGQLRTPDQPEQRFALFMSSTSRRAPDMYVYLVVADYGYPEGSGWSVGVRQ